MSDHWHIGAADGKNKEMYSTLRLDARLVLFVGPSLFPFALDPSLSFCCCSVISPQPVLLGKGGIASTLHCHATMLPKAILISVDALFLTEVLLPRSVLCIGGISDASLIKSLV